MPEPLPDDNDVVTVFFALARLDGLPWVVTSCHLFEPQLTGKLFEGEHVGYVEKTLTYKALRSALRHYKIELGC